jgi:hypothetical protein
VGPPGRLNGLHQSAIKAEQSVPSTKVKDGSSAGTWDCLPQGGREVGSVMMKISGLAGMALVAALVGGQVGVASACNCPKEQLVKKYGSVSQIRPGVPLPPPLPPDKAGSPAVGG